MIRIALVDDKKNNRIILADKLSRSKSFEIAFEAINGEQFLEKMATMPSADQPEIVLMDLEMPVMDGIVTIAIASALYPDIKYVVLTIFDDDDKIFNAIKAGACGYLLKEESSEIIADMLIHLWDSGVGPVSPSIAHKILQIIKQESVIPSTASPKKESNIFHLSEREEEILTCLCQGMEYKEIGEKLSISLNTVKKHVVHIYEKLHVNNKTNALRIAYTRKLL
jgi:DNA-binding NarL/FixJ family response regulator